MDIRFILPEEVEQLQRNVVTSFPSKTPSALLANMKNEIYRPEEGRYLGCFDDSGELIGSALLMDFTLNVRGIAMPMGAAAYVSTHFLHKKERVARNLLRVFLGFYTKTGASIGCLHPFSPAFYNKMGFGYCNSSTMYSPKPSGIRSTGNKSDLSYATERDQEEILAFYRGWAAKTHGATIHPFMDFHRIFDLPYVVICRRNGKITGYFTFEFIEVDHYTDMYHDLAIREMVYEDTETLQQFLTFFASQVDQIDRVRIYSPDETLHFLFENADSGENKAFDGAIQEIGRRNMGFMCRILDIPQYFAVQQHCQFPVSRDFVLELRVNDSFMPNNHGVFQLEICRDQVKIVTDKHPDVILHTGIADLSSLVMGALPLSDMLRYGRMQLSDPAFLRDVQCAIGWDVKPQNYTYF